jgi:hypothetical protein
MLLSRPHLVTAPQFLCASRADVPLHTTLAPAASCSVFSTCPSVATPWLVSHALPAGVSPSIGSTQSVHPGSSPCAASNLRAPLLPLPRSCLAPVRPPMPLHRTGGSSTPGGAYDSSQSSPDWALELTNRMDHLERRFVSSNPSMVFSAHSPQVPQSGTQSPWILDSRASFHMTPDSTHLDSTRSLPSPVSVKTADGTPLPVVSHGTLRTP